MPDLQYIKYEIKEWWERLGVRAWVNRNPKIVLSVTVVSAVVFLVIVIWLSIPEKVIPVEEFDKEWFYDLNTGELFADRAGQIPPIAAPSGPLPDGKPAGVRAYVFSYSLDPNSTDRFIGFLETTDPNADRSKLGPLDLRVPGAEQWGQGRLIRRVEDEQWFSANGPQGRAIMRITFRQDATGRRPHYCAPD